MKIQLKNWKILKLNFSMVEAQREKNSFGLKTGQSFDDDKKNSRSFSILN